MQLSILVKITILSIICTIGITFLLLGCMLPNSYWPMFILLFYICLPVPFVIATGCDRYGDNPGSRELAIFITAILMVSTFGLPVVIFLRGDIQGLGLCFALIANVTFIATAIIYALLFHRKTNEFS